MVPNIEDEYERKRTLDEIPQSAQGRTIMTTEPKFVPSNAAKIKIDDFTMITSSIPHVSLMINALMQSRYLFEDKGYYIGKQL